MFSDMCEQQLTGPINPDPVLPATQGTPMSHTLVLTWYTQEFAWSERIIVTYFVSKLFKDRNKPQEIKQQSLVPGSQSYLKLLLSIFTFAAAFLLLR